MPNGQPQIKMPPATAPPHVVQLVLDDWPRYSRRLTEHIIEHYGLPNEVTSSLLIWHAVRPWKRIVVYREGTPHNFPRPHLDLLEQTVDYRVPANKHDELAAFDGSIIVDRTRGEMSVRCNSEAVNMLVLNLAHDIVMDKLSAEQARQRYGKVVSVLRLNWPEPYTRSLQFDTGMTLLDRENFTSDPDHRAQA